MRSLAVLLVALLPAVAVAQAPGDTVSVVVPEDRNCSDFQSEQDAQGWYDAVALITGEPDAHGLDADGDGQPCEGLEWSKIERLGTGYEVRYQHEATEIACGGTVQPFTLGDLMDQAVTATRDSIAYRGDSGLWPRWECVHTISRMVSQ